MRASVDIGERLKSIRKAKGFTLVEIAKKTGLSTAYLSNIERNQASPTLNNLFKIGRVLEIDPIMLMEETPDTQDIVVRKKSRKLLVSTNKSNIIYESVTGTNHDIASICITIREHYFDEIVSTGHNERDELGIVTTGSIILMLNTTEYHLNEGDSIFIAKGTPHSYRKEGPGECVTYWFYSKPQKEH